MGKFIKGDVVVIPFPFSDLSAAKRRPAVVLANPSGNDLILAQITSKNIYDGMSITLDIDGLENGSLSTISNIRPNKLFTADENILQYKIGELRKELLATVIEKVVEIFTA
jgi:mRNA interferase MazF